MRHFALQTGQMFPISGVFSAPDDAAASAVTSVNSTAVRPDVEMEWPEGDLPEQMGGMRTTLMPGISLFKLPANLDKLWHDIVMSDGRRYLANGSTNPNYDKKVVRRSLKMDRNNPMVVVGGPHDGEPMTWSPNTNPRARGKKDNPQTSWISEIAYLLRIGLADASTPTTTAEVEAAINAHAGHTVRLEHGLSGQCRADKVRYIRMVVEGQPVDLEDPSQKKGCGNRAYTKDFRNAQTGQWSVEVACDCGLPTPDEQAIAAAQGVVLQPVTVIFRGYESVERILPPLTA